MGCSSAPGVRSNLEAADPNDRVRAIVSLVDSSGQQRSAIVAALVDRLEDEDEAVRVFAIAGLYRITGERLRYKPSGAIEERHRSVEQWRSRLQRAAEDLKKSP